MYLFIVTREARDLLSIIFGCLTLVPRLSRDSLTITFVRLALIIQLNKLRAYTVKISTLAADISKVLVL